MYPSGLRSRITRTYAAVIGFSGVEAGWTISEALLISWILGYSNICLFGIWVRSSKSKLPERQASPGILLSFADCQVRASFRVVGNALFFAELFYFVYVQQNTNVRNASCLKSRNQFFDAYIPIFPSFVHCVPVCGGGE